MDNLDNKYGILLKSGIKLQRQYFKQMCKAIGINCIFRAPKKGKNFDLHGDLDTNYEVGRVVGCIFDEYPDQKTLKKRGWVTELQQGSSMLHVPYDLEGLENGALFIIPSGIDGAKGRVFRVLVMQNIMIYPASIACEIAPEYESTTKETKNITQDYTKTSGNNMLVDLEDDD